MLGIFQGHLVLKQRKRLSCDLPNDRHQRHRELIVFKHMLCIIIRPMHDQLYSMMDGMGGDFPCRSIQLLAEVTRSALRVLIHIVGISLMVFGITILALIRAFHI